MSNAVALERVNFFDGKLLAAQDLSLEQTYHLERHRRHNRYLHGWGVVSGLSVSVADNTTITVHPGVAIDCAGNELVVGECMHLSLNGPWTSTSPASGTPRAPLSRCRIPRA